VNQKARGEFATAIKQNNTTIGWGGVLMYANTIQHTKVIKWNNLTKWGVH
jgi:hypothetical protein